MAGKINPNRLAEKRSFDRRIPRYWERIRRGRRKTPHRGKSRLIEESILTRTFQANVSCLTRGVILNETCARSPLISESEMALGTRNCCANAPLSSPRQVLRAFSFTDVPVLAAPQPLGLIFVAGTLI